MQGDNKQQQKHAWRLIVPVFFTLTVLMLPAVMLAEPKEQRLEWSSSAGGDVRWFDWREHQGNKQLLREAGPLASVAGQFQLQYQHVFTRVKTQWGGGLARYDGHLQSGPAYEADAWEKIIDTEWRLGWQEERGNVHMGFMQRDWRRYIEGGGNVSSAEERYRWRLLTVGAELAWFRAAEGQAWFALDVGRPVESHQKVYSATLGNFNLEPGDGIFWRVALPWQGSGKNSSLHIEPYYQQQDMKQSKSVVRQDTFSGQSFMVYQPASIRREFGVSVGWRFGGSKNTAP